MMVCSCILRFHLLYSMCILFHYIFFVFFFFKQKTAYEMRISDWSSDVCSSDLLRPVSSPLPRCRLNCSVPRLNWMPCSLSWPSYVPLVSRSDCISSLYLPGSAGVIVTYMPSTPVHLPAQLAKRVGAVAGPVVSAPAPGAVSVRVSGLRLTVGGGPG